MSKVLRIEEMSKDRDSSLVELNKEKLDPLPAPYDTVEARKKWKTISNEKKEQVVCNLDGFVALGLPQPKDEKEEKIAVDKFISGLKKLLTKENNWSFLQPLTLSLEYCAKCQTCNDACPVFVESGRNDLYRPT